MNPDPSQEPDDPRLDQAMSEAAGALWQLPVMAIAGWWGLMAAPWLPAVPRHRHSDPHEQLVVPEPLEETGEHALFA